MNISRVTTTTVAAAGLLLLGYPVGAETQNETQTAAQTKTQTGMAGEGECSGGACGTPQQSGGAQCVEGDCQGGCGAGSVLVANTDLGDTYQYADDADDDGWEDDHDNCARKANADQADSDGDQVGDACDLCPNRPDPDQKDSDGDGLGNACDPDMDNDGVLNGSDNCEDVPNASQTNTDKDTETTLAGNACDDDDDGDGVLDVDDTCPLIANPNQDPVTSGVCDEDIDKDGRMDSKDNCVEVPNSDQLDSDKDGRGDLCDGDMDDDGVPNVQDNCQKVANPDQLNADRDLKGDACDERFCFVVEGDETNCLDPTSVFQVYSPSVTVRTGEDFRLRLFANRTNTAMRYTWTVKERPSGSTATVNNPRGTVRLSSPYEYFYLKNNVAKFNADEPGVYKIQVTGEMVFPDQVNANFPRTHSYVMTVKAEGESTGGCAVNGNTAGGGFALLLLASLWLLRRRRQ